MKKLFLAVLTVLMVSCSSEEDNSQISQEREAQATQSVSPVYNVNWVYYKKRGKSYVNIQWYSEYGFPFQAYTPHYVTIKQDGVVRATMYQESFNRYSQLVPNTWQSSTFEITQTLIGVGESEPVSVYTFRQY